MAALPVKRLKEILSFLLLWRGEPGNRKVEKTGQKSKQQVTNDSIQTQN